jgi:hypothetical protein
MGTRKTRIGRFCTGFICEYLLNQCYQRAIIMEHGEHGLCGFTRIFICEYLLNQRHQRSIPVSSAFYSIHFLIHLYKPYDVLEVIAQHYILLK